MTSNTPINPTEIRWQTWSTEELKESGDLLQTWNQLNARTAALPFLDAEVMRIALDVFGDGSERVVVGERDGQPVAMAILCRRRLGRWETFQPSQVPLGAWCSVPDIDISLLTRSLLRHLPRPSLMLSLTQLDPMFAIREADTATTQTIDYIETAWIELQNDFDTYWAGRGKNLRQNIRKQLRRLTESGRRVRTRTILDRSEIEDAVRRYGDMESAGWKAGHGTAIRADNAQGTFYIRLLETLACRGEAVVFELLVDDQVVASDLCVTRGGTLVVLKTTYDETFSKYSPAFLLRRDEVRWAFENGAIQRIEFYGRLKEWHTRWTDNKRTLYHMTNFRLELLKSLAKLAKTAKSA